MFDDEATQMQREVPEEPIEVEGHEVGNGEIDLFPDTPAPMRAAPVPQAHRVRITGVSVESSKDTLTQWLKISYTSLDTAGDDALTVFLPQQYIDNPAVDPETLSKAPGPIGASGRPTPSEHQKYAAAVRNHGKAAKAGAIIAHSMNPSDGNELGDGTLETLIRFAKEQDHKVRSINVPRTFVQVAEYLNGLCTGTECVALLLPQGGDGEFSDRLRTRRFVSPAFAENVLKGYDPNKGRGYRRLWLNE
jgi:hypothetical protein